MSQQTNRTRIDQTESGPRGSAGRQLVSCNYWIAFDGKGISSPRL